MKKIFSFWGIKKCRPVETGRLNDCLPYEKDDSFDVGWMFTVNKPLLSKRMDALLNNHFYSPISGELIFTVFHHVDSNRDLPVLHRCLPSAVKSYL